MQLLALEQLASKGVVTIAQKGGNWVVECIRKNEAGFLVDRQMEWGRELGVVIDELLEKVSNAE